MKKQVGIIGLGKFGLKFGQILTELGHEVLGIDHDSNNIQVAQRLLTQVFQADAMNRAALEQIRIHDLEYVLVSVGDSIAASAMISMYLKELGVPKVWVKAVNKDHEKLLHKIGVDEVVIPEYMAASQMASQIATPGFIEHLSFDKTMGVQEFLIDYWAGKNLRELDITNTFDVQVIAVRDNENSDYRYIPKADQKFSKGQRFVAIGKISQLAKIKP
jgi:trk system potassium uptake protein TrkA